MEELCTVHGIRLGIIWAKKDRVLGAPSIVRLEDTCFEKILFLDLDNQSVPCGRARLETANIGLYKA